MWKASTKQCFLKNNYDKSKNDIDCADCTAYSTEGAHFLVQGDSGWSGLGSGHGGGGGGGSSSRTQQKDLSWASETGIWMPKDIAAKLCRVSKGHDQPAEYNIHSQPLKFQFSFQCCNECAKQNG